MPRHEIKTEMVAMRLADITTPPWTAFIERIDDGHANSPKLCRQMDAPEYLTASQGHELKVTPRSTKELHAFVDEASVVKLQTSLPQHCVVRLTVELSSNGPDGGQQR